MKVLQLLAGGQFGGAESLALALNDEWRRLGHETLLAGLDPPCPRLSGHLDYARATTGPSRLLRQYRRLAFVRGLIDRESPDVLLAHSLFPNWAAMLGGLGRDCSVFGVLHSASNDYRWATNRVVERIARRGGEVVAVSGAGARQYQEFVRRPVSAVIPNGVPRRFLKLAESGVSEQGLRGTVDRPLRVLTFGRMVEQKDFVTVVKGAAMAVANGLSLSLRIVGGPLESPYGEDLRDTTERLGLSAVVELVGPSDDIVGELGWADIAVLASIRENHPVAFLECLVAGVPVITSDIPEFLSVRSTGPTFPVGDSVALGELLVSCSKVPPTKSDSEIWWDRFGITECARSYMDLFSGV